MAETQSLPILDPRFEAFAVSFLHDFVDEDQGEMLPSPTRALKKYLGRTK